MASIYETRAENLKLLAKQHGGQIRLSLKLGFSRAWLSQLIGRTASRQIHEKVARQVEEALALEEGWLDKAHSPKSIEPKEAKILTLEKALAVVAAQANSDPLSPMPVEKFASLCSLLLEQSRIGGGVEERYVLQLLTLARR